MAYKPDEPIQCVACGEREGKSRKLCDRCWMRARRAGTLAQYPILGPTDVFQGRIQKSAGCWVWRGSTNGYGYGLFVLPGGASVRAHRYSYEFFKGPIPAGMVVMHSCDNPPCVNPAHLSVGTKAENNADAARKGHMGLGPRRNSKLSEDDILAIRASPERGVALAAHYSVSQVTISAIRTRKTWRHIR